MARSSTEIIERAAETGLGVVRQQDLPDPDSEFGWQRPRSRSGMTDSNGHLEIALPRTDAPQGTGHVLMRVSDNPATVFVLTAARFRELIGAAKDGQYDMAT